MLLVYWYDGNNYFVTEYKTVVDRSPTLIGLSIVDFLSKRFDKRSEDIMLQCAVQVEPGALALFDSGDGNGLTTHMIQET
jgi:hypothetical protein